MLQEGDRILNIKMYIIKTHYLGDTGYIHSTLRGGPLLKDCNVVITFSPVFLNATETTSLKSMVQDNLVTITSIARTYIRGVKQKHVSIVEWLQNI